MKNFTEAPLLSFHKKVFLCFILGQIASGYALGIAGNAVTAATDVLSLNSFWQGLLGAGTLIGLGGSVVIGNVADKLGRSKLFLMDMVMFTGVSILQLFVNNVGILLILRILLGLSIAIDYTVGSALLTEWMPSKEGPKFQSYLIIFWICGYVASFFAGVVMTNISADYHLIFVTSALPGVIAALVRLASRIPESPSWLAANGKVAEANQLIQSYVGKEYGIEKVENQEVEKVSWAELFGPKTRTNTLVGGVFYACQVFPYFGVGIFLPILVAQLNMGDANMSSILYDIFCIIGAIVGVYLCNRISRRSFLLSTFYISAAALVVMILGQSFQIVTVIAFAVFALAMSVAVVMENPYPPELFNTRMRASGVGAVIAMSRIGAAAGTFLLPILVEKVGVYGTLAVCLVILLIGGIFCQKYAPETSLKYGHPVE